MGRYNNTIQYKYKYIYITNTNTFQIVYPLYLSGMRRCLGLPRASWRGKYTQILIRVMIMMSVCVMMRE